MGIKHASVRTKRSGFLIFLLAGINVVAITAVGAIVYQSSKSINQVVRKNEEFSSVVHRLSNLREAVHKIYRPVGKDGFGVSSAESVEIVNQAFASFKKVILEIEEFQHIKDADPSRAHHHADRSGSETLLETIESLREIAANLHQERVLHIRQIKGRSKQAQQARIENLYYLAQSRTSQLQNELTNVHSHSVMAETEFLRVIKRYEWILLTMICALVILGAYSGVRLYWDVPSILRETEESEKFNRALVSASIDAIVTVDEADRILHLNPSAESLFSYTESDVMGKKMGQTLVAEDYQELYEKEFYRSQHGEESAVIGKRLEFLMTNSNSEEIPVELATVPVNVAGKQLLMAVIRDLRSEKAQDVALKEERAKVLQSSKMAELGEIAGGVAHEINNPVAIIHGMAKRLFKVAEKGEIQPERIKELAQKVERQSMRISKIVNGLRVFSRDGTKDPAIETSVAEIVEQATDLTSERLKNHGVALEIPTYSSNLTLICQAIPISQVLVNLINNAHDAVEKLEERWVRIDVRDEGSNVVIMVTDSGKGIPKELRDKILQPFFTTKGVGKGTGLGLSISRGIIENHNGKFEIDEKFPNTRFVITLPKKLKSAEAEHESVQIAA